jgi:hypothetical protein
MAVKVTACGSVVRLDFGLGAGFETMGLTDSITPFPLSKAIVETPDLSCNASAEVGREEQSTMSFTQFWDPQDATHNKVETNFIDSKTDLTKRDIDVQLVSPDYATDTEGAEAETVTWEAVCQIVSITPEELTPDGFYKRTVVLLRKGEITKTVTVPATTTTTAGG